MAFGTTEELKIVVKAEVDKAVRGLKQVQGTTGKIEGNFKKLGMAAVKYLGPAFLAGAVLKAGKAAVMAAAGYEQLKVSLEVLLGSASKAEKLFASLREFAVKTPLQLDQLARSASTLMAFGSASETVVDTLRNLGNLAQGMPDKLERLVLAYGKVQAKGKATLEELNMFTEAGVPLMAELGKQTGLSRDELFKYITAGKVGFKEVDDAVRSMTTGQGQFAGMLEKQSETLIGLFSTAKDSITDLAAEIGLGLLPSMKGITSEVILWLNNITAGLREARALKEFLAQSTTQSDEDKLIALRAQRGLVQQGRGGAALDLMKMTPFLAFTPEWKERLRIALMDKEEKAQAEALINQQIGWVMQNIRGRALLAAQEGNLNVPGLNLPGGAGGTYTAGGSGGALNYAGAYPLNLGAYGPANSPYNFAAGAGSAINYAGAYPFNNRPIGPVNMPGRAAAQLPEGDIFWKERLEMWGTILDRELQKELGAAVSTKGIGVHKTGTPSGAMTEAESLAMRFRDAMTTGVFAQPSTSGPFGTVGAGLSQEVIEQTVNDWKDAIEGSIKTAIIDSGINAFMELADAIGYGEDALTALGRTFGTIIPDMMKTIGLMMVQAGLAHPYAIKWGLVATGLGLAFGGAAMGGMVRKGEENAGGGNTTDNGTVNVIVNGDVNDADIFEAKVVSAIAKARSGYK